MGYVVEQLAVFAAAAALAGYLRDAAWSMLSLLTSSRARTWALPVRYTRKLPWAPAPMFGSLARCEPWLCKQMARPGSLLGILSSVPAALILPMLPGGFQTCQHPEGGICHSLAGQGMILYVQCGRNATDALACCVYQVT